MVHRVPAAVLLVPLEKRESGHPEEVVASFRDELLLAGDLDAEGAEEIENGLGLSGREQDEIAIARAECRAQFLDRSVAEDFLRIGIPASRRGRLHPEEPLHTRRPRAFFEIVETLSRKRAASRHAQALDSFDLRRKV